jgi:hypothetical protein
VAKLTAKARKNISKAKFGVPSKAPGSGSYPMPDRSHAVNAMARASGKAVEAKVRAKAHALFPGLGQPHPGVDKEGKPRSAAEAKRPSGHHHHPGLTHFYEKE